MTRFFPQNSLKGLISYNVGLATIIFLLLEVWRPYYFLTDDNLSAGLPFLTEMGRHLKEGVSPFISDYLFGGNYNYLRDPQYFAWHPLCFLVSLFADTPARFAMLDIIAFVLFMITTVGFTKLAWFLREECELQVSNLRLTFYTLSFVYSTYILSTGASWVNTLGNQSALPWLTLGILDKRWKVGAGFIALFSIHQLLCGQLELTVSNIIFLSLFAMGVAFYRKSWKPLVAWGLGHFAAFLIVSPLLLPAVEGFFQSDRSRGLPTLHLLSLFSLPMWMVPTYFFLGNYTKLWEFWFTPGFTGQLEFPATPTLLACAASWCLIPALGSRARWRYLEVLCLGLAAFITLLIIRPDFISEFMLQVPILRSMRWPFREILQLLFFIHLFLILRPQMRTPEFQNRVAVLSLLAFLLPLPISSVPVLNLLGPDREALFSGQADRFWSRVKSEQLKPGDQIVSAITPNVWAASKTELAYSLMGTANFPAYFEVHSLSGYSLTAPRDQLPIRITPALGFGTFGNGQIPEILREAPIVKIIVVQSVDPLVITLYEAGAPPVDLTPYLAP